MERLVAHTGWIALFILSSLACADDLSFKPFYKVFSETEQAVGLNVKVTSDKGFVVVGKTKNPGNGWDAFLSKFKGDGTIEWTQNYGTAEDDEAVFVDERVVEGKNAGYLIFGNTTSDKSSPYAWCRNVDPKGVILAKVGRKDFDYLAYDAQKINFVTLVPFDGVSDPHYLMTGMVKAQGKNLSDAWIAKADSYGKILKEQKFGYSEKEWGMSGAFVGRYSAKKVALVTNTNSSTDSLGRVDHFILEESEQGWKAVKADAALEKINDETKLAAKATAAVMTDNKDIVIVLSSMKGDKKTFSLVRVNEAGKVVIRSPETVTDDKDRVIHGIIESKNENKELIVVGSVVESKRLVSTGNEVKELKKTELPQFWLGRLTQHLRLKWQRTFQNKSDFEQVRYNERPKLEVMSGAAHGVTETEDNETIVVGSAGRSLFDVERNRAGDITNYQKYHFIEDGNYLKVIGATCEGNCHKK